MKIALFTDSFLPQINGVSTLVEQMKMYFDEHNIDYMIFAPQYREPCDDMPNIYRLPGFKFIFYPEAQFALPDYIAVKKRLDVYKPDVLHIMTPFSVGICGLLYAIQKAIPVIVTYNTNYADEIKFNKIPLVDMVLWQYLRWFYNKCDTICCPSSVSKAQLLKHRINNALICPNGTDVNLFNTKRRDEAWRHKMGINNKVALLYVGRIAKEKNLFMLMDTMDILNTKGYYDQIKLIMVGDGPLKNKLMRCAPPNVYFTGYLKGTELLKAYASCDLFIFPSYIETFGNAVLEAMASGLPIIGAKGSGCMDIVQQGLAGILCNPWNPTDFASAIETLIKHSELRRVMSHNATIMASQYTWDNIMLRYMYLYTSVSSLPKNITWLKQTIKLYRLVHRSYTKGKHLMNKLYSMVKE